MNKIMRLLASLPLLIATHELYATQMLALGHPKIQEDYLPPFDEKECEELAVGYCQKYSVPSGISKIIKRYLYTTRVIYQHKEVPSNLSNQDLTRYDFTGCQFTCTDLTNTILNHAIFDDTVCNYEKIFQLRATNQLLHKKLPIWYDQINQALQQIAKVYPLIDQLADKNRYKAQLLLIASGLSNLPLYYYQSNVFSIKNRYWFCTMKDLDTQIAFEWQWYSIDSPSLYLPNILQRDYDILIEYIFLPHEQVYPWFLAYDQTEIIHLEVDGIPWSDFKQKKFNEYLDLFYKNLISFNPESQEIYYQYDIGLTIYQLWDIAAKNHHNKMLDIEILKVAMLLSRLYQWQKNYFIYIYYACLNCFVNLKKIIHYDLEKYIRYQVKDPKKLYLS